MALHENCGNCGNYYILADNYVGYKKNIVKCPYCRMLQQVKGGWKRATEPPKAKQGNWSDPVAVVTNFGNLHRIAHYGDLGIWQRPGDFKLQEIVVWWTEFPEGV